MKTNKILLAALLAAVFCSNAMHHNKKQKVDPWSTDTCKIILFSKIPRTLHYLSDGNIRTYEFTYENFIFDKAMQNLHFNATITMVLMEPRFSTPEYFWLSIDATTGEYTNVGGDKLNFSIPISRSNGMIDLIDPVPCKAILKTIDELTHYAPLIDLNPTQVNNFKAACVTPDDKMLFIFLCDGKILKVVHAPKIQKTRDTDIYFRFIKMYEK